MVTVPDPYNEATRANFANPMHAGDLPEDYNRWLQGEALESAVGARVLITLGLVGEVLQDCRFRVFGCPHLIAAAEWLCDRYEGRTLADLARFRISECVGVLGVATEKTGRLLLLEDAIGSLAERSRDR